jgi:hypothetical protein
MSARPASAPSAAPRRDAAAEMRFRTLLYRYLFHDWLFKDASRGNLYERTAALRHNRTQARWLPLYMRRWSVIGLGALGIAAFVELVLQCPLLSAFFYVPCAVCVPYNTVLAVGWAFLTRAPGG